MNASPVEGPEGGGTEPGAKAPFATALVNKADHAQVLAQGRGPAATQMAAMAQEHNVPVLQDFALSQALQKMPVGTQIPEPLFKALAGLLEYVFREEAELARQDEEGSA